MNKTFSKDFFQYFTHWWFCKYSKGNGLTKQNMNFKLDKIYRLYPKHQGLTFLALTPKSLCKIYMNNSYTLSFLIRIVYLFNMILTIKDETNQQYFKSGLSYNDTLSVLSAHHNVSLSIHQLKGILKIWVYCEERQKTQSTMFFRLF